MAEGGYANPTPGGEEDDSMPDQNKATLLNRLKTVRGHLDGIVRMVEEDTYCVDVMKQVAAVQSSLERINRMILKSHLETCFSDAVRSGNGQAAVAELVDAVKFNSALTGPSAHLAGDAVGEPEGGGTRAQRAKP